MPLNASASAFGEDIKNLRMSGSLVLINLPIPTSFPAIAHMFGFWAKIIFIFKSTIGLESLSKATKPIISFEAISKSGFA